ncbi:2-C-methyl-D-erythritol 4-phosphate cytidylyltransferase, partial [Paenibacillus riograndensis]
MSNSVGAVIVAAGRGTRMGTVESKQYLLLQGKPIIVHTLEVFQRHPLISEIVLVTGKEDVDRCREWVKAYRLDKVVSVVTGGSERQHSVHLGLRHLKTTWVMVHDGVRPFVQINEISACYEYASEIGSSALSVPVIASLIQVGQYCKLLSTLDRLSPCAISTLLL